MHRQNIWEPIAVQTWLRVNWIYFNTLRRSPPSQYSIHNAGNPSGLSKKHFNPSGNGKAWMTLWCFMFFRNCTSWFQRNLDLAVIPLAFLHTFTAIFFAVTLRSNNIYIYIYIEEISKLSISVYIQYIYLFNFLLTLSLIDRPKSAPLLFYCLMPDNFTC